MPLVSIIIPTYNRAHLIGKTLNSIETQTYTNWECIIIDDGSTDGTENLISNYVARDSRFKYYKRPEYRMKGANACRNYGFELSKGNYINWFDSDDIMLQDKLGLQVEQLEKDSNLDYSICQSLIYDNDKKQDLGFRGKLHLSGNRFEDYILFKIFWLTTAPLWKRKFVIDHNLRFDESLYQSQEYDFHIRALSISENFGVLNEPLVKIIRHSKTISHEWKKDTDKVVSNITVKLNTLRNYSDRLSSHAKLSIIEMLTLLYKDLLIYKRFYDAKQVLKRLNEGLHYVDMPRIRKLQFLFKARLMYFSYRIFGRGYNILKPIT